MNCWICGQTADSREHKIKKSLLKDVYAEELNEGPLFHLKDNKTSIMQGPNSTKIKYSKSLCSNCNNTKSQPYDRAFDEFSVYVRENMNFIKNTKIIDFDDVFETNFEQKQLDLFKYFVKLFGCDLIETGEQVPLDLIELFQKEEFLTKLRITISIDETVVGIGIGELFRNQISKADTTPIGYKWHIYFSNIRVTFWYNFRIDGPYGAPWIADSQYIYLGNI